MKSIPNRACGDKRRHAQTLPEIAPIAVSPDASALPELHARLRALLPSALAAAATTGVSLSECPPLDGEGNFAVEDVDTLGEWLSLTVEIARSGGWGLPVEALAERFEEDFVHTIDKTRDRLAVVTRLLARYAPPVEIEDKELLRLMRAEWEQEERELWEQLEGERAVWEERLQMPGLDDVYWWCRDMYDDLMSEETVAPFVGLVLAQWKREGLASQDVTVEAVLDVLFYVEGDDEEDA